MDNGSGYYGSPRSKIMHVAKGKMVKIEVYDLPKDVREDEGIPYQNLSSLVDSCTFVTKFDADIDLCN